MHLKEIVTRAGRLLHPRAKPPAEGSAAKGAPTLSGKLSEMGLVDLVQTLELGRKSGVMRVEAVGVSGALWLRDGSIVDAELGGHRGEDAIYRLLGLSEGHFEVELAPQDREDRIRAPTHELLAEGVRRIAERRRLCENLPSPSSVLIPDFPRIAERLAEIPDEVNPVLRLVDGHRTVGQIALDCELDEIGVLECLVKLLQAGLLVELQAPEAAPAQDPAGSLVPPTAPAVPVDGVAPEEEAVAWFQSP
jgi:hypothetical protein